MPWHSRHRVGPNREFSRAARCEQAAPVTQSVEPDNMPVQDPLRVAPQQAVHDIRRTIGLDEVDFAQSPSPWLELDPRGSSKGKRTSGPGATDGQRVR